MLSNKVLNNAPQGIPEEAQTIARQNISAVGENLVADAYDSSKFYDVNAVVFYEHELYRCKVATSNPAGNWSGNSNWETIKVTDFSGTLVIEPMVAAYDVVKAGVDSGMSVVIQGTVAHPCPVQCQLANIDNTNSKLMFVGFDVSTGDATLPKFITAYIYVIAKNGATTLWSSTTAQIATESELAELIARKYDNTKAYAVGEACMQGGLLYKCSTEISQGENWNVDHWTLAKISDIFSGALPGLVPNASVADADKILLGNGTWSTIPLSDYVHNGDLGNLIVALYSKKTYAKDDFCIYNKKFYQCKSAISTAEDFNPQHWDEVTILQVLDAKISAIDLTPYLTETDLGNVVATIWDKTVANTVGQYVIHDRKLYKCIADTTANLDWDSSKWNEVNITDLIEQSNVLHRSVTASINVGGVNAGDTFAAGTSNDDMWNALLNPALYPTLTDPSASLSYSVDTYHEVGSTISAKTATVTFNRGSINPAYGTSGYRSGAATNYAIATSGADTEFSDSSANSGTFNVSALTRSTKGNITLTATVSYSAGEQPKDSKGNNYNSPLAAGSKTASKTMQFIQAYFYGKSASATVSNFTGLTKSVTTKGQKQFSFTTNNEFMVFAYDSSYGDLTSILDSNGFETISGWTKTTLTVDGFSYYVYVANSATTDTNAQFTFKY